MAELIDIHYTLDDGTEEFCQVSSEFTPEQREAFKQHVMKQRNAKPRDAE